MDPNNPGQTPGDQAPPPASPPWGTPPPAPYGAPPQAPYPTPPAGAYGVPPEQPPYGTPPQEPYGTPPQAPYGAPPQPPYGAPPQPPYGAPPAWGVPAPVAPRKSRLPRILAIIGGVIVVLIILAVVGALLLPNNAGKVIFTTDAPTDSGAATCQLGHQVTSVTAGTPVYANYFFKDRLTNQTVTLTITKDGTSLGSSTLTSAQSNGVDCLEDSTDLSTLGTGTFEFKLTTADGTVVSDGKLTITK